ncbi:extracellular matrix regulator RemB [Tuberibacillus sp. Marseille-P3662]|uniref:extracellular matrix regulator RemB n=1 Tax=Tuberibacillus sp. Marseille-P3662 TaxID=1965358 RepID=UPI000A1C9D58|nr:extracellular matrix/biofilm biosynthesis regulator RemA family protein [Tuberibacillus sp. Marseille-P3662]
MFIHLGEDTIIRTAEVIAIFDYDLFNQEQENQLFIENNKLSKRVVDVGEASPKSVIITDEYVYFSPFSPSTLRRRSDQSITEQSK